MAKRLYSGRLDVRIVAETKEEAEQLFEKYVQVLPNPHVEFMVQDVTDEGELSDAD